MSMFKINVISVGKIKKSWLDHAIDEYITRLRSTIQFDFIWAKNDSQLVDIVQQATHPIALDERGEMLSSTQFSQYIFTKLEQHGSRMSFVIGGAEGLPPSLKKSLPSISLSTMTFPHQIVRLLLLEQIYRSVEIMKGTPYHK